MELLKALTRPTEFWAMLQVKRQQSAVDILIDSKQDFDLHFCYQKLKQVSRSFAAVIAQLDGEVRDAVCIFYLVLRALDTIEDDMAYPKEDKIPQLRSFHEKLQFNDWFMEGVGYKEEKELLENYFRVVNVYQRLPKGLREPIRDICERMGNGMADYITLEGNIETVQQYEEYCHYVAGLVGHGLSALFAASGLEDPSLADELVLSNSMGLFLQKTNIIRDYLEDIMEEPPRMFWPKEIWGQFSDDFHSFKRIENRETALLSLNAMVADALKHLPDCISYLKLLRDPTVFKFCAIPQSMAIATLFLLYNNGEVFEREVKIRKGEACQLILSCGNLVDIRKAFQKYINMFKTKLVSSDPSFTKSMEILDSVSEENISALHAEGVEIAPQGDMTRNVITSYGPLGGTLLYNMLDSLGLNANQA